VGAEAGADGDGEHHGPPRVRDGTDAAARHHHGHRAHDADADPHGQRADARPTGVVLALVSTRAMLPCVDSAVVIGRRAGRHRER